MSKALLFSDLHCNNRQLQNLYDFVIQNNSIDVIIFAGDVVNMGEPVWFMEKFIKTIDELKIPFFWVPGNNDFGRAYYKINAKYKSLEGKVAEIDVHKLTPQCNEALTRRLTGVGGSPASWSGQYEGESMIDKKKIGGSIFISHVPPPGILVLQQKDLPTPLLNYFHSENSLCHPEQSEGSIKKDSSALPQNDAVIPKRRFSDSPLVHICGHIHYRWGTAYLGQTKVIQLASLETGHYAILDLETLAVKFERFR